MKLKVNKTSDWGHVDYIEINTLEELIDFIKANLKDITYTEERRKVVTQTIDKAFIDKLLELMLMCAEGDDTDNCDLSFEVGKYLVSCNITFNNPTRIGD